jgi:hypothetical protein
MSHPRRYELAPHVVFTPTADEALLLKLDDETIFMLNPTGARTVQLIVEGLDEEALLQTLAAEYGTTTTEIAPDTMDLLNSLLAGGLMRMVAEEDAGGDR